VKLIYFMEHKKTALSPAESEEMIKYTCM
jgi:hypothetical protein